MVPYRCFGDNSEEDKAPRLTYGFTLREALKEPFYWIAGFSISLLILSIMGVYVNGAGFMGSQGMMSSTIGKIVSISYIFATIGKLLGGLAVDRFGVKRVIVITVACSIIGTIFLSQYKGAEMWPIYGYMVFFGFGLVTTSVVIPLLARSLFGNKDLSAIMGTVMAFFSLGGVLAAPSGTLAYDRLGSYVPAFYMYAALSVVALGFLFVSMYLSRKKLNIKRAEAEKNQQV